MYCKIVLISFLAIMLFDLSSPLLLKAGQCPLLKPKRMFNINEFLGEWFVILRDRTEADCIRQNITTNGLKYFLTEIREPLAKGIFTSTKSEITTDRKKQSQLFLGTEFGPKQPLLILMTDYDNYAVTYACFRSTFGHRQLISILSRSKTLSQIYLNKIYRNLHKLGLSTRQLSTINQEECEEPELNENGFAINKPWVQLAKYSSEPETNYDDDKYWR